MKSLVIHTCTFQTMTDFWHFQIKTRVVTSWRQGTELSLFCWSVFFLFLLFLSLYFLRHFHSVFHCAFLVGFPIDFQFVFFCISTAYLIVYFYLQFQLYLIAYFSQVKLGSDSSTHLKVFLQTHSGKLETATYLVRASLSNSKLELNSDLNINLNLNSNFESGGPPSPSLIQPQDYKRGLLIIWKANKI